MEFILKGFKEEISVSGLANVHYFEFTQNLRTVNDSHPFCELVYVEKGTIRISSDNYTGELSEGQFILHGAQESHSLSCEEAVSPNIIIIGFECNSDKLDILTHEPLNLTDELEKMLAEIIKEGRTVYLPPYNIPNVRDMKKRQVYDYGADQLIKSYLEIFLIKCIRHKTHARQSATVASNNSFGIISGQIGDVKKYLDCNFCQRIKIDDLCFLFNTNKTSLSKAFREAYGQTIIDYVNGLRVDYTKKLMKKGEHTLTDIAAMLNMSSVHYLTSLFKKTEGVSPTEYLCRQSSKQSE